ncbi:MAG TPA: hypothetical protein VFQ61_18250 [Polyangiaceae bacterium]|nr:hypothetical protein [Polyangiaceae bacterium]
MATFSGSERASEAPQAHSTRTSAAPASATSTTPPDALGTRQARPSNPQQTHITATFEGIRHTQSGASLLLSRGDAHAHAALSACVRSEASLSTLLRSIQQLAAHVSTAQAAKDDVAQEVEHLRSLLVYADEQQLALKHHNVALEQALRQTVAQAEAEAARERAFLVEQQDAFIIKLLEDHELALTELRAKLRAAEADLIRYSEERRSHASTVRSATSTSFELTQKLGAAEQALARMQAERDRLLADAERRELENRELRQELETLRTAPVPSTAPTDPPPIPPSRIPGSGGVPLAAVRLESRQAPPRPELRPEALGIRTEPYLSAATSPASAGPNSAKPALKSKPDASTRPLIGYSLIGDELHEELVDSGRGRSPKS